MAKKSSRGTTTEPDSKSRKVPANGPTPPALSEEAIEQGILDVLKKHTTSKGLTNSELLKKCSSLIKRSIAVLFKRTDARAEEIKGLLYILWEKGLVFFEPPNRGQKVGRVWGMESARLAFPSAFPSHQPPGGSKDTAKPSQDSLKAAYDKFVPEHLGGFVPIFKVRRELGWPSQVFDNLLQDLNERKNPLVELHPADPGDLTEEDKRDSFRRGGRLLVRMRWR